VAKVEKPKVERQERFGTPAERAENEFRQAVSVLKLGRSSEAETHFIKALESDSSHRGARQALIALHLERGQLDAARKLLQDGLAVDPAQPDFAIALARIYVERKDLAGALAVLDRSAGAAGDVPEFHVLRGTLLQRLSRHAEAAESYQTALQARATLPQAWVGLGISYEQLGKGPEAAEAFRRALAAGPLSTELKTFAEQRIRALR
jgi:MSHA biogenesis protein MshN